MVRKISSDHPKLRSPQVIRAPLPLEPVRLPRHTAPREGSWMAELLFETTFGQPHPQEPETLPPSSGAVPFSRAELTSGQATVQLPRSPEEYRGRLHSLFDPARDEALRLILKEPILASSRAVWTPGRPELNRRVAYEFMRYFMPVLQEAYGFKPAPVEFNDQFSAGFDGMYDHKNYRVYLPSKLLSGTFERFVDVLVHEQMHCLQEGLIGRLFLNKGKPLEPEQRAIATYWRNEQPKYRSAMANGAQMSPQTRKRYNEIGQEYHSVSTGEYLSSHMTRHG